MCTIMCCVQIPQMCDILKDDCLKYKFFLKTIIFFNFQYSSLKMKNRTFRYGVSLYFETVDLNYYIVHVFKAERGSV